MPLKAKYVEVSNPIPTRMRTLRFGLPKAIQYVGEYNANEGQNFMRANAPWTDRTGNARQGLFARYFRTGDFSFVIVLWHSVPYGIWLELAHDRKYKIIEPAWRRTGQQVMSDLNRVMGKIRA